MKIGVYKNLNLGKKEITLVTKEEVDSEITKLLESKVKYETKDSVSALGDTVNIDFEGFLDGVPFDGGKDNGYDLELGSGSFIPGFEEQLVGYAKDSDVDVNVTFPTEYHAENLAGKAVVFKCHINEVKARVMAELNDEFAQEFGIPDAKTLVETLESNMNAKRKNDTINEYVEKAIRDILSRSEIEASEDEVKAKIDQMVEMYEAQMAQYGMNMESYLGMSGKSLEEFRNDLTDDAINSAKEEKLMDAIATVEKFMINDDELMAEMMMYKAYYQLDDETFKKFQEEKKQDVYTSMMRGKVATFLYENNN